MPGPSRQDFEDLYGEEEGARRYNDRSTESGFGGFMEDVNGGLDDTWNALTGNVSYRPDLGRVNTGRMDPSRENAMGLQSQLAVAASGQGGPSAAQSQLQAGTQAGLRQQLAMAASARGGMAQQAAARRQGMTNAAMQQGQASNEAAALRAREQQAAQAQLAGLTQQQQQNDLGIEQANLSAQTANQQQRMQIAQGNAEGKQRSVGGAFMALGGLLSDIRGKEDIQSLSGYETAPVAFSVLPGESRESAMQKWSDYFASRGIREQPATEQPATEQKSKRGLGQAFSNFGDSLLSDRNSKEQIAGLRAQLDAVSRENDTMRRSETVYPETAPVGRSLRALSTADGSRAGLAPVDAYQYRYKPDAAAQYGEDTAPRAGVMAQELEESPYLRSAVVKQPDGRLGIDASRGLSASLAAAAGLDKRLRAIETQYPRPRPPMEARR